MDMYTLLYLTWINNEYLLHSTGNYAQCYRAVWIGGEFGGGMDTCKCMAESPHCSPEIITILVSAVP